MKLKPKTKRNIIIFILLVFGFATGAAAIQTYRVHSLQAELLESKSKEYIEDKIEVGFVVADIVKKPDVVSPASDDDDVIVSAKLVVEPIHREREEPVPETVSVEVTETPEGKETIITQVIPCDVEPGDLFGFCKFELIKAPDGTPLGKTTWHGAVETRDSVVSRSSDPKLHQLELEVKKNEFKEPTKWALEIRLGYGTKGFESGFTKYGKGRFGYWGQVSYDALASTTQFEGYAFNEDTFAVSGGIAFKFGRK